MDNPPPPTDSSKHELIATRPGKLYRGGVPAATRARVSQWGLVIKGHHGDHLKWFKRMICMSA